MEFPETVEELNKCSLDSPKFDIKNEAHLIKILECYDGDTLTCYMKYNGKYQLFKIRMLLYNSPEMKPVKKDADGNVIPEEERQQIIAKAKAAKHRLEELTLNKIGILTCHKFDAFGRILGMIQIQGMDKTVNQIMLDEGHGVFRAVDI